MARSSPGEQRNILALAFEASEDGYIYYRHRWSRGLPVTAEEREEFLRMSASGSRSAWRKGLKGRQTLPPRAYDPVMTKLLAAMPRRLSIFALMLGVAGLIGGIGEPNTLLAGAYVAVGCVMLAFGALVALARMARSRARSAQD